MIKTRVIPTLLYKDYTLVKGVKFDSWRRVGSLLQAIKVYSLREVDELIFLDISATPKDRSPDFNLVDDFADECFIPLVVGGGIRSVEDVKNLLRCGADKVCINSRAVTDPGVIETASKKFGSQCIVVSIDAKTVSDGKYAAVINSGKEVTNITPVDLARQVEKLGAGEILLTSVDRDGTMEGYDLGLIKSVTEAVTIPVIASGGVGNFNHMFEALSLAHASAVAAASIYHFTQMTPLEAKYFLKDRGIKVRI